MASMKLLVVNEPPPNPSLRPYVFVVENTWSNRINVSAYSWLMYAASLYAFFVLNVLIYGPGLYKKMLPLASEMGLYLPRLLTSCPISVNVGFPKSV